MIAPALVSLLLAAVDPCEAVPGDLLPDRATAAVYREVAQAEEAADDAEAASIAYREALRRDPADETSRTGLASLCARRTAGRRFDEGVERMRAGDWAAAAAAFAEARAGRADADAALLEGVARMELGEDARATGALAVAAEDPRLRDAARFHQGLLALRAGSATRAVEAFEDAARGGGRSLATLASQLARQARQAGRLLLVASADVARDSNPGLDDRDPTPDTAGSLGLLALVRPLGRWGPYLRGQSQLLRYETRHDLDFTGYDGAAGWQLGRETGGALGEYDLALRTLGGEPYLTAHRGLLSGWAATGPVLWTATAMVRLERYAAAWDPFSGTVTRGELRAAVPLGGAALASLSYGVGRDRTDTAALSWIEHGPRADLQVPLGTRVVLLAAAGAAWRDADGRDETLGATRRDLTLDGSLDLELDLHRGLFLRGGLAGRLDRSSVPAYSYQAWTPSLGVRYELGR